FSMDSRCEFMLIKSEMSCISRRVATMRQRLTNDEIRSPILSRSIMHFMQASNSRTCSGELCVSTVAKRSSICRSRLSSTFSHSNTAWARVRELTESAAFEIAIVATSKARSVRSTSAACGEGIECGSQGEPELNGSLAGDDIDRIFLIEDRID